MAPAAPTEIAHRPKPESFPGGWAFPQKGVLNPFEDGK